MKHLSLLIASTGLLLATGCAADDGTEAQAVATSESAVSAGNAVLAITNSWSNGYCAQITMTNGLSAKTSRWKAAIDLKTSTVNNIWGAKFSKTTGLATVTPVDYTTSIAPGASISFGFCAVRPSNSGVLPTISAWNMESGAYATCPSNSGLFPSKAALAVAMASELGRWDPVNDLVINGNSTTLSATGAARCTNDCKNTKALLGQQDSALSTFLDTSVFDPNVLRSDLTSSMDRQKNLMSNLVKNYPAQVPPAHKLTRVAGPTNLGMGACGPHYVFQVDNTDGSPLTTAQASNMANTLCYFGQGSCGNNTYLAFTTTSQGCPSGRTCIAIDPTDGDNSSTSTTTAGSAPTYPLNRVYDPNNTLLGSSCMTTRGLLGKMVSKCSTVPSTCGYLYCMAI